MPVPAPEPLPGSTPPAGTTPTTAAAEARRPADGGDAAAVREAEWVLGRTLDDPRWAAEETRRIVRGRPGTEASVVARRALGLATRELGDPEGARTHLREAIADADAAGLAERAAQVRLTLVGVLADLGRLDEALRVADQARPALRGTDADRLLGHRALILCRAGRFADGLRLGDDALARLRAADDPTFVAGLLGNRGLARAYAGDLDRAADDLTRAARVADGAGLRRLAAMTRVNLGFVARRRGDLAEALRLYALAEPEFADAAGRAPVLDLDRATALLAAGLGHEARRVLAPAVEDLAGHPADAAEARMTLAHAELACGDAEASAVAARAAHAAFTAQGRTGWALLAEQAVIRARVAAAPPPTGHDLPSRESGTAGAPGETSPGAPTAPDEDVSRLLSDARRSAERLQRWGWRGSATYGRVLAGGLALALGRVDDAAGILAGDADGPRDGTAGERIAAWHATALYRLAHGRSRGALAAVRAGLRVASEYAEALGAVELRAHASVHGAELAALGLRMARRSGRATAVLAWAERGRAVAGRPPAVRPPADPGLAAALADLRRTDADLTEAIAAERPYTDLLRRHHEAEDRVRTRARTARRAAGPTPGTTAGIDVHARLVDALGDRALVEFVPCDGELLAVTLAGGHCRTHELGAVRPHEFSALAFALNRAAQRHGGAPAAARDGLRAAAAGLDRRLFPPGLRRAVADRELVIAPCGPLHGVAWAALPATAGRPCTVTPSAAAWPAARACDTPRPGARTVLVAGPDVPQAPAEIAGLAALHRDATVLTGADARTAAVADALDGAGLAHISAHATVRAGSAPLSRLLLADGALYGYELEAIPRPPRRVVLSTCDAARGDVTSAGWPLGPASTLLGGGTATVIASVAPVHDEETAAFMVAVHRRMAAGATPAHALAAVPRTPGVLGFNCLGAGT